MIKYIDEFRNKKAAGYLINEINKYSQIKNINIMEVCGGHTLTIMKYGLKELLPENINLLSGPGCPVCVTPQSYIDEAVALSKKKGVIITSFGDMLRVPGTKSSLLNEKSGGADIRICLSSMDAINIAGYNPDNDIVFLGIGFETTAPTIASSIQFAKKNKINNYSVLTSLKTMPEAMESLLKDDKVNIDAFICPGHVSAITGTGIYADIPCKYKKPCVVSGFEPTDMLEAVLMIVNQINNNTAFVENQYSRVVDNEGNIIAKNILNDVFEPYDAKWRGIGIIKNSGLKINKKYEEYDAVKKYSINIKKDNNIGTQCICGNILKGINKPDDCKMFAKSCTPLNPIGACMVSTEGTCNVYYKYKKV